MRSATTVCVCMYVCMYVYLSVGVVNMWRNTAEILQSDSFLFEYCFCNSQHIRV